MSMKCAARWAALIAVCTMTFLPLVVPASATPSPDLVISQIYGGGGNTGAPLTNDFIEIFNRGSAPVSLSGKSLQYASATGTGNFGASGTLTLLPNVTLMPGQYFLVQEAGGTTGSALPAPDATGTINMSATGGKVALVNSTTSLGCNGGSTACSSAQLALIIDLVGYDGANFFETSAAPALSNTTAAFRAAGGCTDTDNNATDFVAAAPAPRNSASSAHDCGQPTALAASASASPASVSAGDQTTLTVIVTPGASPTSTGITVTGDLSVIGGSASQSFTDNGNGTFSYAATVQQSTSVGSKSLQVTASDAQGRSVTAAIALTVTAAIPKVAIHDIQGTGIFGPYAGQVVQTEGIVTAIKSNGYFIQASDFEADADPNTSEGIFVFTGAGKVPAAAAIANRVQVRGTAQDFIPASDPLSPPVTEIAGSPSTVVLSTGNSLPAPVTITSSDLDPAGSISRLAKYEGMRVQIAGPLTVVAPTDGNISEANATSTSTGVFFVVTPGVFRPFREPGIEAPAPAPAGVPQFDGNPERLRIDTLGQIGSAPIDVASGAIVSGMTGVLDFAFRTYTLDPDPGSAPTVTDNDAHAIPVRAAAAEGEVSVASFNLERFYDTADDAGTSDVVLTPAAFQLRLTKASLAIRNVLRMPDILGVEEMENLSTLQALAQRIDADAVAAGQTPPNYQPYLFEGNDVGGIDVGVLVKNDRIQVLGVDQVNKNETFTQPDGTVALLNDRPPLVLRASVKQHGKELPLDVTVIVNHLRSLSGIEGSDAARIRVKRLAQAESLARLIDQHQILGEKVISVGDYNAFDVNDGYVDVINTVRGGPLHPTEDVLGESTQWLTTTPLIDLAPADPAQHYSYVFGGNAQVLDHIIVSQSLTVNEFTYARNDADFPEVLRNDGTRPERISDHDAPVAYFAVTRDTVPPTVTLTGVAEGATYLLGSVPNAVCSTTDDAAGVKSPATLQITGGDANGVGSITATCTGAVDNVGNVAADVSVHYTVVAYTFGGFAPPIGSRVAVKSGSTLPVKFQIFDWNGNLVSDTAIVSGIEFTRNAGCAVDTSAVWDDATAVGSTTLQFDGTEFQLNWKTTGLAPGCYSIAVKTRDTLVHSAPITIK